jgi:prepilin-type N-terminal cleavage/methylation domain-containing protein
MKRPGRGFTLIEVILSLTILAVVATAAASCLMAGMKLWNRATRQSGGRIQTVLELERIAQELKLFSRNSTIPFEGAEAQMSFPTVDADGIAKVSYRFDRASSTLFRSRTPLTLLDKQGGVPELRVGSFKSLSFSYLKIGKDQDKTMQFTQEWAPEDGPFTAVRFEGETNGEHFAKTAILPDKI